MDLNKKTITEQESRLQTVITELDDTIDVLIKKTMFLVLELQEMTNKDISNESMAIRFAYNQPRMYMTSAIAYDYLVRIQNALEDIIARETRKKTQNEI